MAVADGDESAIHLPNQLASTGSMDLIENEFQFLKDYDSSGVYLTVSVIEEEPTDLECSESLMTIKSYRDTQKIYG